MKKLFYFVVFLALLVVGAIFLLPVMLSSDGTRQALAARISEMTGAQIILNGPVEFSVFPDLGLVASELEFTLPDGSISAVIPKMVAGVNLAPLIAGRVEITGLELTQPDVTYLAPENQNAEIATSNGTGSVDPIAELVSTLEKIALHDLSIIQGKFTTRDANGQENVVSNINLHLSAPDLDDEIAFELSALNNDQTVNMEATLSALRPILARQPADFSLALKLQPAPHPALADVTAGGKIRLGDDQSYQISDGLFTSLGQPLRLDALYRPGERPYISFDLEAKAVDLSSFVPTQTKASGSTQNQNSGGTNGDLDVSQLTSIDMDAAIAIGKLSMDEAQVDNIDLQFSLENGVLNANLGKAKIKDGIIAAQVNTDFNVALPVVSGKVIASRMNISHLAKLADVASPLSGTVGISLGYAFSGLNAQQIRSSLNAAGKIVLVDAKMLVPELKSLGKGNGAGEISQINAEIDITDLQQPMSANGGMVWNGEAIKFTTKLSPSQFLEKQSGSIEAVINSRRVDLDYNGRAGMDGSINGAANVKIASLDGFLDWLNLGGDTGMKGFEYSGGVSLKASQFGFSKATISASPYNVKGSGSVNFSGKPKITADLAINELDLAQFTGNSDEKKKNNSSDTAIDLSPLQLVDADVKLRIAKIIHRKLKAGPLQASATINNGSGRLKIPNLSLYGGKLNADLRAAGAGGPARISGNVKLAGVDSSSFLRDAEVFDRMEGKLNSEVVLQGTGASVKQLTKSLNGNMKLNFTNGAVRGIDVAKLFNNVNALMAGGFKPNSSERTEFNELGMTMIVSNGVAKTSDLKLIGPVLRMEGAGQIDIGEEKIAMRVDPRVVGTVNGQSGTIDVSNISLPIIIEGPLDAPRIYPDLTEVLKNPQVFLQTISKLGIDLKNLGGGKLNIENVLKQGLGGNSNTANPVGQIGNVIGNILTQNNGGNTATKPASPSNPAQVMGALLGQVLNQGNSNTQTPASQITEPSGTGIGSAITATGQIPIPVRNPRIANPQPVAQPAKPVQTQIIEKVVDQVAPKLKLPVDNDVAKKTLDNVFKQIFQ